jgi:hypothetical protein
MNIPHCDGFGIIRCRCGGDLCLCGLDQEQCEGCGACDPDDYDPDYDDLDDDEEEDQDWIDEP